MFRSAVRGAGARWTAAAGCLLLALAAAPAAHAAFTGQGVASAAVATAGIGSPTAISVTPACSSNKKTLTVTVNVTETVPYANLLEVTITSGTESATYTQGTGEVRAHSLAVTQGGNAVDYAYTVRGLYRPAGSANTWRSAAPLAVAVRCA